MAVASPSMVGFVQTMASRMTPWFDAVEELAQAELLAADAVQRAQRAPEDVVAAPEPGALHGHDVARVLDDADDLGVAAVVAADGAQRRRTRPR